MKTIIALAIALFGTVAMAQTLDDICDPQYAEADEGFSATFCGFGTLQKRKQLNRLLSARKALFHKSEIPLTPRGGVGNRNWVKFPTPEGWELKIARGSTFDNPGISILYANNWLYRIRYTRDDPEGQDIGEYGHVYRMDIYIFPEFYDKDPKVNIIAASAGQTDVLLRYPHGCIEDHPTENRYVIDRIPVPREARSGQWDWGCDSGRSWSSDSTDLQNVTGTIDWYITQDNPLR